jgi:peroxiredoxin
MSLNLRKNWLSILLIIMIVLMAAEIGVLMHQNRQLRSMIENPVKKYEALKQNQSVPPLSGIDLDGNAVTVEYSQDEPYTLMLWFSASCPSCEDNLHFWNMLFADYDSENFRLIGVCSDDPDDARRIADEYGLDYPVIIPDDESIIREYGATALPLTMLISPEGAVVKVWPGPLMKAQRESVITALVRTDT